MKLILAFFCVVWMVLALVGWITSTNDLGSVEATGQFAVALGFWILYNQEGR